MLDLDQGLKDLVLEPDDFHEIAVDGRVLLKTSQVVSAAEKFERFGVCPRFSSLVKDDLHERLERRLTSLSKDADLQEEVLSLNIDEQSKLLAKPSTRLMRTKLSVGQGPISPLNLSAPMSLLSGAIGSG